MTELVTTSTTTVSREVNATIRAELARRRVSLRALGAHLDLSATAIHRRLSGSVSWTVDELVGVADLLGVSVADLFTS